MPVYAIIGESDRQNLQNRHSSISIKDSSFPSSLPLTTKPPPDCDDPEKCQPCDLSLRDLYLKSKSSVNGYTGSYHDDAVDLSVKVTGGQINLKRYFYRTQTVHQKSNTGAGKDASDVSIASEYSWMFYHGEKNRIHVVDSDRAPLSDPDFTFTDNEPYLLLSGAKYTFKDGVFQRGDDKKIVYDDQTGEFKYTKNGGFWKTFNGDGTLKEYGNPNGVTAKLNYVSGKLSTIADRFGNVVLTWTYTGDSMITVTDYMLIF
jgi:hypothetical protein